MPEIARIANLPPVRTHSEALPPSQTVRFPADFGALPSVLGGSTVRIELPAEELSRHVQGPPEAGWRGTLCYQVDGSETVRVNFGINGPDGWQRSHPVELFIPRTATQVVFWLELSGAGGLSYYSNYGRNFAFQVEGQVPSAPPTIHPPPRSQVADRWGRIIGRRAIEPPTPVVVINASRGNRLGPSGSDAEGKIEWK